MSESRARTKIAFAFKLTVSATLLGLLLWKLGSRQVLETISGARKELLLVALLALIGQTALSTLKWRILLREQGVNGLGYPILLKIYLVGNFINLFMPSMVVGDAYRAAQLRPHASGWQGALSSVLVDRATGLGALLFIGLLGMLHMHATALFLPGLAGLVILCLLGYAVLLGPVGAWAASRTAGRPARLPQLVDQVVRALRPGRALVAILFISVLFQFNTVVINWIYCRALGLPVNFETLLAIVPVVYLLEVLPISINGIGVREGAFAFLFGQVGQDAHAGVALGLCVTVMRYVAGSVGGIVMAVDALRSGRRR